MIGSLVSQTDLNKIIPWFYEVGIVADVISGIIVAVVIAVIAFIFRNTIVTLIKRLLPQIESRTPHINFEVKDRRSEDSEWESTITVSNAGNEPAYNIYVFYFEQFSESSFKITASNTENLITRPVLGIHDSLEFHTKGVRFEGCNVTCHQEIWVEYENSLGVAFRVVNEPGSPRGDVAKIRPPKIIKRRLEQLPGASKEGAKKELSRYKKGKETMLPRHSRLSILRWRLSNKISSLMVLFRVKRSN